MIGMSNIEREARDRIERAYSLIRSAYRLHPLNPQDTISGCQSAIADGADAMAADIREEAFRAA